MGEEDLLCGTDEQLEDSLDRIKTKLYDEYQKLHELQYALMLRHDKLSEGIYKVTYSNGTEITVNYNTESYEVKA